MAITDVFFKKSQEEYGLNIQWEKFEEKDSVYLREIMTMRNAVGNMVGTMDVFLKEDSQAIMGIDLYDVQPFFEGEERLVLIQQTATDVKDFKENFHVAVKNMSKDVTGSARRVLLLVTGDLMEFTLGDLQDLAEGMLEVLPAEAELVMGLDIYERGERYEIEVQFPNGEVEVVKEGPSLSLNCIIM